MLSAKKHFAENLPSSTGIVRMKPRIQPGNRKAVDDDKIYEKNIATRSNLITTIIKATEPTTMRAESIPIIISKPPWSQLGPASTKMNATWVAEDVVTATVAALSSHNIRTAKKNDRPGSF
eukprot:Gb_21151 [translate_table: standard]